MKIAGQTGQNRDGKRAILCFQQFSLRPTEIYFSGTWDKSETELSRQFSTAGRLSEMITIVSAAFVGFSTAHIGFPQNLFSAMYGTAGQTGLNIIETTIKCPTKVSHFRDERDSWDEKVQSASFSFSSPRRKDKLKLPFRTFPDTPSEPASDFALSVNNTYGHL